MAISMLAVDPVALPRFNVVQVMDPRELDDRSSVSQRLPGASSLYTYRLRDRALWRTRFDQPIFGLAIRGVGSILVSYGADMFATEIAVGPEERRLIGFTTVLAGQMMLVQDGTVTTGTLNQGLAYRPAPGNRWLSSDNNARTSVFLHAAEVETALEQALEDTLRKPLEFQTALDWSRGLAASLKGQLEFIVHEFARPDGIADNPTALASMTDLLATLVLCGAPHNYSERLDRRSAEPAPAYVRRAEEFMRAHCAEPLRMTQVAVAAGCSVRTLTSVFRHFRDRTPLGVLQGIRLEQVYRDLSLCDHGSSVATIACRYGFTNATRFAAAFRRRFGEAPSDMMRRAPRM